MVIIGLSAYNQIPQLVPIVTHLNLADRAIVRRRQKVIRSQLGLIYGGGLHAKGTLGMPCIPTHLGQLSINVLGEITLSLLLVLAALLGIKANLVGECVTDVC